MRNAHNPQSLSRTSSRAFSLIEMMVVLGILVLVLAIVIPAVNAARTSARKAATLQTLTGVSQASSQFVIDKRRLPGYFSLKDLADNAANRGFTSIDNVLLDLAGAITTQNVNNGNGQACDLAAGPRVVDVGPLGTVQARVDLLGYGSTKQVAGVTVAGYLKLDERTFKRQCLQNSKRVTAGAAEANLALPTLVDYFGQPVLAWQQDTVAANAVFASEDYSTRARFYRRTNRGFLNATALGDFGESQTDAEKGSLLAEATGSVNSVANRALTMEAIFGNPASPDSTNPNKAADARASLLFHSAGKDGVYLGKKDRGGKRAVAASMGLQYQSGADPVNDGSFDDIFVNVQ